MAQDASQANRHRGEASAALPAHGAGHRDTGRVVHDRFADWRRAGEHAGWTWRAALLGARGISDCQLGPPAVPAVMDGEPDAAEATDRARHVAAPHHRDAVAADAELPAGAPR